MFIVVLNYCLLSMLAAFYSSSYDVMLTGC